MKPMIISNILNISLTGVTQLVALTGTSVVHAFFFSFTNRKLGSLRTLQGRGPIPLHSMCLMHVVRL